MRKSGNICTQEKFAASGLMQFATEALKVAAICAGVRQIFPQRPGVFTIQIICIYHFPIDLEPNDTKRFLCEYIDCYIEYVYRIIISKIIALHNLLQFGGEKNDVIHLVCPVLSCS